MPIPKQPKGAHQADCRGSPFASLISNCLSISHLTGHLCQKRMPKSWQQSEMGQQWVYCVLGCSSTPLGWGGQARRAQPHPGVCQAHCHLHLLVLRLIHVQLTTTHPEPIQLKTHIFLRFLFCTKPTSPLQLAAQQH